MMILVEMNHSANILNILVFFPLFSDYYGYNLLSDIKEKEMETLACEVWFQLSLLIKKHNPMVSMSLALW